MGKFFEEFSVGDQYITPDRVITEQDIAAFADLTEDHNPIHVDPDFAARSVFGRCIAHGPMMVGITFGLLSKLDLLDGTVIALKGIEWSFDGPIKAGDAVHVQAEVVEARLSRKTPDRGAVTFKIQIRNQENQLVQTGSATGIMMTKDNPAALPQSAP